MVSRRRTARPTRDLAPCILAHLGTVTNKAIGEIFGVGYTAVTEAVKRAEFLLSHNEKLKERVNRILSDF
jgi:chromosomal replication initiation ATPase DnaA